MSPEQLAALEQFNISTWKNPYALTLGLRWRSRENEPIVLSPLGGPPPAYVKNLRHFLNVLNRRFYRGAARNGVKRLQVIAVLEQDRSDRFHYHLALDRPNHVSHSEFCDAIAVAWNDTHWGHSRFDIQPGADAGWAIYMLKRRSKANWFDAIDWENFNNPLSADA